jgi:hypothetical protein
VRCEAMRASRNAVEETRVLPMQASVMVGGVGGARLVSMLHLLYPPLLYPSGLSLPTTSLLRGSRTLPPLAKGVLPVQKTQTYTGGNEC